MPFSLLQLTLYDLEELAESRIPPSLENRLMKGSIPPAFVAERSLKLAEAGLPTPWSTTFLIADDTVSLIVGGCGFKTAPNYGIVEIGYGVAPSARGRGAATSALKMLLCKAYDGGASEVLAEVAPTNDASTRVVQKAGFRQVGSRVDHDGEFVLQWVKHLDTQEFGYK